MAGGGRWGTKKEISVILLEKIDFCQGPSALIGLNHPDQSHQASPTSTHEPMSPFNCWPGLPILAWTVLEGLQPCFLDGSYIYVPPLSPSPVSATISHCSWLVSLDGPQSWLITLTCVRLSVGHCHELTLPAVFRSFVTEPWSVRALLALCLSS